MQHCKKCVGKGEDSKRVNLLQVKSWVSVPILLQVGKHRPQGVNYLPKVMMNY